PLLRLLTEDTVKDIVAEAKRILAEIGVFVEYEPAKELLLGAGAKLDRDGRVLIDPLMVNKALETAPAEVVLYDRDGGNPVRIGGDEVNFDPGSAAIRVYDYVKKEVRNPVTVDCIRFSLLTDRLKNMALQSTCVVPADVPKESADRHRLFLALSSGRKAVITGTFAETSFEPMYRMLTCVRGDGAKLRKKPLAIFDCCPSPPLKWSELTCRVLVECAKRGVPAELVSMPLTGATSPVTLLGAVTQHAAEDLSGVVIHQLAGPGSPIIYGGSPSGFDLRKGTTPMGAIETMMIDASYAQVGKYLNLPTHAYMGLSDSKNPDWQAGMEGGMGAVLAALAGVNMVSGPGMLDFESCQSLENLLLQNEACGMALRLIRGMTRRDEVMALDVLKEGLAAGHFLALDHTRKWSREEFYFPGPAIDRVEGISAHQKSGVSAMDRAHEQVERILSKAEPPPLDKEISKELERLAVS
ncbi:MAG: trimethylamine methyltransferase family protein, partial [Planctomycetes bacterium]|nr:trimethylamine methyltransferase family protein [Planctomycetota bacterium]